MSVNPNDPVKAQVVNNAFISRTAGSTSTTAIVAFKNNQPESGSHVNNIQFSINQIYEAVGIDLENDDAYNDYSSENYISDGDNRKVAIEKLDTQLKLTQDDVDDHESRIQVIEGSNSTFYGFKIFQDDVLVMGNFTVNGSTTVINSTNLAVTDQNITVNDGGNDASSEEAGIDIERTTTNAAIRFEAALASKFKIGLVGSLYEVIVSGVAQVISGLKSFVNGIATDTISEYNSNTGVTVDGLLIKDGNAPSLQMGGDVTGSIGNTTVIKIQNFAVHNGSPANNDVLKYNSANQRWEPATATSGSAGDGPLKLENISLVASIGSNQLTIALKDGSGSDPNGGSPVEIAFGSISNTVGTYNIRQVTSALSCLIDSGDYLGMLDGVEANVWIYAIDNAGTVELAVSLAKFSEHGVVSTGALGSGADTARIMYSNVARSNVPYRLIGVYTITEATAGTHNTLPSKIKVGDLGSLHEVASNFPIRYHAATGSISGSLSKISYSTRDRGNADIYTSGTYVVSEDGDYDVKASVQLNGTYAINQNATITIKHNSTYKAQSITFAYGGNTTLIVPVSDTIKAVAGDTIEIWASSSATTPTVGSSDNNNVLSITKIK